MKPAGNRRQTMTTKNTAPEYTAGQSLCILVGSAVGHSAGSCAIATTTLHPTVDEVRPKAIRVSFYRRTPTRRGSHHEYLWIPRKALQDAEDHRGTIHATLARWFRPDEYGQSVISRFSEMGHVTA
jgi:hypothetical protein